MASLFGACQFYNSNNNIMSAIKSLPIAYTGVLHEVKIVAFSVPKEEVLPNIPQEIIPVIKNGRVLFSMVSVELKNMRANIFPVSFGYHHVAIRMCVSDNLYNTSKQNQGVYFYKSYTNKPLLVAGGNLLTAYKLESAKFTKADPVFDLESGSDFLRFAIDKNNQDKGSSDLFEKIQRLDRAYFVAKQNTYRTLITRSEWPIQWADCYAFETNLFKDVKVEGAFYIDHPIYYKWNKPALVKA